MHVGHVDHVVVDHVDHVDHIDHIEHDNRVESTLMLMLTHLLSSPWVSSTATIRICVRERNRLPKLPFPLIVSVVRFLC